MPLTMVFQKADQLLGIHSFILYSEVSVYAISRLSLSAFEVISLMKKGGGKV